MDESPFCSDYCEHNAPGVCHCPPCTFIRTEASFEHAPGCPQVMVMYTIYRYLPAPEDKYYVREVLIAPGKDPVVGKYVEEDLTLLQARFVIPARADTCIPRSEDDAPEIVETWI